MKISLKSLSLALLLELAIVIPLRVTANPVLTPGVWTNLTPTAAMGISAAMLTSVAVSPENPSVLYVGVQGFEPGGLWKSTDGGSTWRKVGKLNDHIYLGIHDTLEQPKVRVDPHNMNHLWVVDGVRGNTEGFWESTDGGESFGRPAGFDSVLAIIGTTDLTSIAVDPTDFNHLLIGSHSWWKGLTNAGIIETKDGGKTWIVHQPMTSWSDGSMGVNFLYEPKLGIGDSKTWLVGCNAQWRTSDAGAHWTQVSSIGAAHGGNSVSYSPKGVAYAGGGYHPIRSTDNGLTWTELTSTPNCAYFVVGCDGDNLYTLPHFQNGSLHSWLSSPADNGTVWTDYKNGAYALKDGAFEMTNDLTNHILYSANWGSGLWAIKGSGTTTVTPRQTVHSHATSKINKALVDGKSCIQGMVGRSGSDEIYNVKGELLGKARSGSVAASGSMARQQVVTRE